MAKHSQMPVAVFDISSSSVAGAHILIPKKDTLLHSKVSVLAHARNHAELKEDIVIERFVDQTAQELDKVATTLRKIDHHSPAYIQILLASPWFISQTRVITYKRATPFVCSQKLIDSLIEKETAYIVEHDMERFGTYGKEGVIIEKQIADIKLNGYSTANPFGKKVESVELFFVVTIAPKSIVDRFKEVLQRQYPHTSIGFTTSPYATYIVARDYLSAPESLMIVDIGEEVTDVAFVKKGIFLYQHSFPVGTFELYRTLVSHNVSSVLEAEALLETYRLGKISLGEKESIQNALTAYGTTWVKAFEETLGSGHYGFALPEQSYVVGDYRFDTFFSKLINTDPLLLHAVPNQTLTTTFITADTLKEYIAGLDNEHIDETVLLAALFTARLI